MLRAVYLKQRILYCKLGKKCVKSLSFFIKYPRHLEKENINISKKISIMRELKKLSILNDAITVCAIMKNNIFYQNSNSYHGICIMHIIS